MKKTFFNGVITPEVELAVQIGGQNNEVVLSLGKNPRFFPTRRDLFNFWDGFDYTLDEVLVYVEKFPKIPIEKSHYLF